MAEESAAAPELLWGGQRRGREIRDPDQGVTGVVGSCGREIRVLGQATLGVGEAFGMVLAFQRLWPNNSPKCAIGVPSWFP